MSRFRQLFNHRTDEDELRNLKTSESDKDDCLIITPSPSDEQPNAKNRKCSAAKCGSQLPIKEQKKDKLQHLKASKSDLTTKNSQQRAAANQSHFYLVINSEDADQPGRRPNLPMIVDQTLDAQRTGRRAALPDDGRTPCSTTNAVRETNRKNSPRDPCTVHLQSVNEANSSADAPCRPNGIAEHLNNPLNKAPSEHHYQNERLICSARPADQLHQDSAVSDQSPALQQNRPPTKESVKSSSFTPKPLKMIKKRLKKQKPKEFASGDPLNAQSNGARQPAVTPNSKDERPKNENSQNRPPANSQQQLNSQINRPLPDLPSSPTSPLQERSMQHLKPNANVSPTTTSSQRRRRQNQSFENLNERLEYICATSASSASSRAPKREHEELKSGYKSEDNLLHIVPSVPRSLSKMSANEKQFLRRVEEQLTSHQSRLADDHRLRSHPGDLNSSLPFFSENPSYAPFEQPERVGESSALLAAMQRPNYVNDPSPLDELCARPRKADLISLRQLKPRRFLVPRLSVTCSDCDSKELIYVNLQFNDDEQRDESNDRERSTAAAPANDSTGDSSRISTSGSLADERKFAGDTEPKRTARASDKTKGDLINGDLSKSIDLALLRSTKPSSYKQSKSDDESTGKVEYCKIDFMATESLKNLTAIRIQNHHLS